MKTSIKQQILLDIEDLKYKADKVKELMKLMDSSADLDQSVIFSNVAEMHRIMDCISELTYTMVIK